MKRLVEKPLVFRRFGGVVLLRETLINLLKKGEAVQYGKVTVGARQLRQLLNLMPSESCLLKSGDRLEVETITRKMVRQGDSWRSAYTRPKSNWSYFAINNGAWLPDEFDKVIVLRPAQIKPKGVPTNGNQPV